MPDSSPRLVRAWLTSVSSGVVEFDRDWVGELPASFALGKGAPLVKSVRLASALESARSYGYHLAADFQISFVLALEHGSDVDPAADHVYVAGDFNGWQEAVGNPQWLLNPAILDGEHVLIWTGDPTLVNWPEPRQFKFVTGEHHWLSLPDDAQNVVTAGGNSNRVLDPLKSGAHLLGFTLEKPLDLAEPRSIGITRETTVPLVPGAFFFELQSDLPLGATIRRSTTTFRLFAPRARQVSLFVAAGAEKAGEPLLYSLVRRADVHGAAGIWEVTLDRDLSGWLYWYSVDGVRDGPGKFDPKAKILDPYALAAVDFSGPGIVVDRARLAFGDRSFQTPSWQDLVMCEVHVRDLTALAPVAMTGDERIGFAGLRKWVESPEFYLHHLGVNCVELQPIQEFDNRTRAEYHWGYMTNSYFSPESSYSTNPLKASGIGELQEVVRAFHRRGMAVILDVVYNHVGEPAHLMFVDRIYYFEQDAQGKLANWSGCGNDLRANAAMARRLIVDSLVHLIEVFGVDGFRFDLAELLGLNVLWEIEAALKKVKPDVILIAEPWSFRGHIAGALRDTGWASWNDGYRDFLREYVRGNGSAERLEYFLRGSPWYFAKWPAQTVNYTESHDDRTWIDVITENPGNDGFLPTLNDRRRTHLMASILFMSVGIPMLSAGQDFLRSKHGVTNTYQRGDLNALDYRRLYRFLGTHTYFADWIAFRKSEVGRLMRHFSRPGEGFFSFFRSDDGRSLAVVLNADQSQGQTQLLYAVNPTQEDVSIRVGERVAALGWRHVANQERFFEKPHHGARQPVEAELFVPALGCGLWLAVS